MFSVATLCCQIERTLSALPNKLRVLSALGVLALCGGAKILGFSRIRVIQGGNLRFLVTILEKMHNKLVNYIQGLM